MAPKKKKSKASGGSGKEKDMEKDAEREALLHGEYDSLTETLSNLKRRAEQIRRNNDVLQNEASQIRMESYSINIFLKKAKPHNPDLQEFISYMAKLTQKRQNEIVTLSDLRQQKLEELNKQREEMVEKHNEQVNGLKKEILEKENELAQLNLEIAELGDVKSLQQQQLNRIAELEQEVKSAHCRHSETLNALKETSFIEKERHKAASKVTVRGFAHKANKEASVSLLSYIQQLFEENHHLHEELQQLIQRAQALRSHHQHLQMKRRQLLMEKKYVLELQCLRTAKAQLSISTGDADYN